MKGAHLATVPMTLSPICNSGACRSISSLNLLYKSSVLVKSKANLNSSSSSGLLVVAASWEAAGASSSTAATHVVKADLLEDADLP